MSERFLHGRDVLDVIALVESKTLDPNGKLTLLSSAIALVAMHNQITPAQLRRGVDECYRQVRRQAPNFAKMTGAINEQ